MGKLSNTMWRILGAQSGRNQSKSVALIEKAAAHDDWAAGLDDDEFAGAARELEIATDLVDRAKFLALVREAADRSLQLRPYDVQLQGSLRMLEGDVVEMATGEGKTLSGAIAAIGHVLIGHKVHVISVNDYLANRDAEWMKPLFDMFGVSVGAIAESSTAADRRAAYDSDVVYGSVNEIGFDVLRDQLAVREADLIAPKPDVAIIDEADSVLVDEALVPLILAGSATGEVADAAIADVVSRMKNKHYEIDTEGRNISLTDEGASFVEDELGVDLYSEAHVGTTLVHTNIALYAYYLLERDVHYIVRDGEVKLINSSRGRVAQLQRWPDGVQAAVELKEKLDQTDSGEVIDTITVQALIGRYPKVCGMTGTALAAGEQFRQFYDLFVSQIPPNTENIRVDMPDRVFDSKANKVEALVEYLKEVHETGQPILIGTHDVAESEELAYFLEKAGVGCVVLNAKNDAQEAAIIADAGKRDAVTVSTQMAGRGTDIRLGGPDATTEEHDEIAELGGLCVVGTGRYDTERLDNQLRGRAGRQGDPGTSVFFSSLEDPLVTRNLSFKRDPESSEPDGSMGARGNELIEQAQRVAEGVMLELHSNTWRYNKLVNQQRDIIVGRRMELLSTDEALTSLAELEPVRYESLLAGRLPAPADDEDADDAPDTADFGPVTEKVDKEVLEQAAREIMLYHLDRAWSDHLAFVSDVRSSIHLRAIGRESPLDEFHRLILAEFTKLPNEAVEAARKTFREATITNAGVDLDSAGRHRSTSTWTYMVHDNLFSSGGAKMLQGIIGVFR
ncbi:accessory Sec system translocase SecA2 [Gordonia sp. X0973]|uniref:accessory Sec system translocase SecA2 n=1 Tax=Gordonia sp. X0973 TaxID=2742602 RepID=UPI000F53B85D|nr:accessory Sec system translocase SecA2 [Gordonia sp. X0973]QKT07393.1 accessory Sec system translocase SecA2 [Gordonia sp. X0973]